MNTNVYLLRVRTGAELALGKFHLFILLEFALLFLVPGGSE